MPLTNRAPRSVDELETLLSTPDRRVLETLDALRGDVIILGAGGKMGPTLTRMVRRASQSLGDGRRVIAVSRFAAGPLEQQLAAVGVETIRCDLTDGASVERLPVVENVVFMAGQKFGTRGNPSLTWATNVGVPTLVMQHFAGSRIAAFSTGNVYPLTPFERGGSLEGDARGMPEGEYAWSCTAREEIFSYYAVRNHTPVALLRLNYAVEMRYGVLVDIASRVHRGEDVNLAMGYVNVIWQGDANAIAIASLRYAATPPFVVNVTGPEVISVRDVAERFGTILRRSPRFVGAEEPDALLSNTALMRDVFGAPNVSVDEMIDWIAAWIQRGGVQLGKPTHFDQRDGSF